MNKPDGGPAFPQTVDASSRRGVNNSIPLGMSLRQYYAAKAMQAILTNPNGVKYADVSDAQLTPQHLSFAAFAVADAMLAEDEKTTTPTPPHVNPS
jgi:hypothetical protein